MWPFYLFFKNAYMYNLRLVGVWGKQVPFLKMTLLGSLLLQHSEEPEPKVTENENDTIISMFTKFYMITKPLSDWFLSHFSFFPAGQKHFMKEGTNYLNYCQDTVITFLFCPLFYSPLFIHYVIIFHSYFWSLLSWWTLWGTWY